MVLLMVICSGPMMAYDLVYQLGYLMEIELGHQLESKKGCKMVTLSDTWTVTCLGPVMVR